MVTRRLRAAGVVFLVTMLLLLSAVMGAAPAFAAAKDPVLLVHGWGMASWSTWPLMQSRLQSEGYRVYTIDFSNNIGGNLQNASELRAKVDRILAETGASKVDIVAHSMGGLSTRYYIKYLGGASKVNDVIELGTPNHGTAVALVAFAISPGAYEMLPGSAFLTALNNGDETPNPVKWTSICSMYDEANIPWWNSMLAGSRTLIVWWPVGHLGLLLDYQTYRWVVEGLNGAGMNYN
jgi:triacylglycerol lipase